MQKLFPWFAQSEQANFSKCHVPLTATESFKFKISVTVKLHVVARLAPYMELVKRRKKCDFFYKNQ